jgi:prephenate dehydrogenase
VIRGYVNTPNLATRMSTNHAIVHGTGLLGASVGLALRSQGWQVHGWDPDEGALAEAVRRGAVEFRLDGPMTGADLVVLAAPPDAIVASLSEMSTDALVTDIAGVKVPMVAAASHLPHFVGGHPMAGGETSGAALATRSMFHGATWVLTADGADPQDIARLEKVTRSLGANPLVMSAGEHDAAVARVSHLPHVLAATLMRLAEGDRVTLSLAGGGFRDLTRIAAADSTWWTEVLTANARQIDASIEELQQALDGWRQIIADKDTGSLGAELESARAARAGLGEHHTQVEVVLLDRPGEIARVGHALEASRVDVRDFQLRHGEHGGGGILTISVKGEAIQALNSALTEEGFEVRVS